MSSLDEMWERLEAHQSRADQRGYGLEWREMCEERTKEAAADAEMAARVAAKALGYLAATINSQSVDAGLDAARVRQAIEHINDEANVATIRKTLKETIKHLTEMNDKAEEAKP